MAQKFAERQRMSAGAFINAYRGVDWHGNPSKQPPRKDFKFMDFRGKNFGLPVEDMPEGSGSSHLIENVSMKHSWLQLSKHCNIWYEHLNADGANYNGSAMHYITANMWLVRGGTLDNVRINSSVLILPDWRFATVNGTVIHHSAIHGVALGGSAAYPMDIRNFDFLDPQLDNVGLRWVDGTAQKAPLHSGSVLILGETLVTSKQMAELRRIGADVKKAIVVDKEVPFVAPERSSITTLARSA